MSQIPVGWWKKRVLLWDLHGLTMTPGPIYSVACRVRYFDCGRNKRRSQRWDDPVELGEHGLTPDVRKSNCRSDFSKLHIFTVYNIYIYICIYIHTYYRTWFSFLKWWCSSSQSSAFTRELISWFVDLFVWIHPSFWVNFITTSCRDLTGIMVNKGNHPQMAARFRLVRVIIYSTQICRWFPKMGVPANGLFIMENESTIGWSGGTTMTMETSI